MPVCLWVGYNPKGSEEERMTCLLGLAVYSNKELLEASFHVVIGMQGKPIDGCWEPANSLPTLEPLEIKLFREEMKVKQILIRHKIGETMMPFFVDTPAWLDIHSCLDPPRLSSQNAG
jgi:hypothetical protein